MNKQTHLVASLIAIMAIVGGCGDANPSTSGGGAASTTGGGPMCATGTWNHDGDPSTGCVPWTHCQAGQHVDHAGSATSDQTCTACESGTFTLASDATSCDAWTSCAPGEHIAQAGSTTADQTCTACESGTYASSPNQSSCTPVNACEAGTFLTMPATPTSPTVCETCNDVGTYCAGGDAAPAPCAPGTWDDDMSAATACVVWIDCIAGQYVDGNGSATTDRACVACASGSLSTTTNATSCTAWTSCSAGQHIDQPGSATADQTCIACASGTFSATTNNATCTPWTDCTAGELVGQPGSLTADRACVPCTSGTFSVTTNAASCASWASCVAGQHIVQDGTAASNRTCAACPSGTFSATANVASCTPWTPCPPDEIESVPGTSTSDRTCIASWPQEFGTLSFDTSRGITTDASGNILIVGGVGFVLPGESSAGADDAFIRKYAPDGSTLWTRQFGSSDYDHAGGVGVDASGNIFVAGTTGAALPGQTSAGSNDAWLRKYTPAGTEIWTRQFGSSGSETGWAMSMAPNGDIVVVGFTTGTLPGQVSAGGSDAYVRMYDTNGAVVWTRQFGTSGSDAAYAVGVDASGNIFLAGLTDAAFPSQTNAGAYDVWVRKYAPDGTALWTQQFGSASLDDLEGLSVDASGNFFIVGSAEALLPGQTSTGGFVRKYTSDGTPLWTQMPGSSTIIGAGTDSSGDVFVTGIINGALPTQTSFGGEDAFVIEYAPDGTLLSTNQFGTSADDESQALCIAPNGDVFVAGETTGSFPQQSNAGSFDLFVARFVP